MAITPTPSPAVRTLPPSPLPALKTSASAVAQTVLTEPPAEPKSLLAYCWEIITSALHCLTLLFQRIFCQLDDSVEPVVDDTLFSDQAYDFTLPIDNKAFEQIYYDLEATIQEQIKKLKDINEDVQSLTIENEKHLAYLKNIDNEKEKVVEIIKDIKQNYDLTDTQLVALNLHVELYETANALLIEKVTTAAQIINSLLEGIRKSFEGKQLANVPLHDLITYLNYEECRKKYTSTLSDEKEVDPFSLTVAKEIAVRDQADVNLQFRLDQSHSKGIHNIGNSCYIASTIQSLIASPTLKELIAQPLVQSENESLDAFKERKAIRNALAKLLKDLQEDAADIDIGKSLKAFRDAVFNNKNLNSELSIWKLKSNTIFGKYERKHPNPLTAQHDAAELMMLILETINYHVTVQEKWGVEGQSPSNTPPVLQPNQLLTLEVGYMKTSLQELIDVAFSKKVEEDRDNARSLNGSLHPKWWVQTRLAERPNVLVIQLKRFDVEGKIETPVELPEDLTINLSSAFDTPSENGDRYKLVSTIRHTGQLGGGHYIAHANQAQGWAQYNDGYVSNLTPKEKRDETSFQDYILILEKV